MLPRRHRGCRHGPAPCRLLQHHSLHVLPPCRREQSLDVLGGMLPRLHAAKARSKANLKSLQLAGASAQHIPVHPRPSLSTSQLLKERRHPTNHRYPHPAIQAKSEKSCCRAGEVANNSAVFTAKACQPGSCAKKRVANNSPGPGASRRLPCLSLRRECLNFQRTTRGSLPRRPSLPPLLAKVADSG